MCQSSVRQLCPQVDDPFHKYTSELLHCRMLWPRMVRIEKRLAIWVMPNRRELMGLHVDLSTEHSKASSAVSPGGQAEDFEF